jgi:hypothetical protein
VALDPLIGQRFAFEDVAEAFIRAATRDSLKTIVDIS